MSRGIILCILNTVLEGKIKRKRRKQEGDNDIDGWTGTSLTECTARIRNSAANLEWGDALIFVLRIHLHLCW